MCKGFHHFHDKRLEDQSRLNLHGPGYSIKQTSGRLSAQQAVYFPPTSLVLYNEYHCRWTQNQN